MLPTRRLASHKTHQEQKCSQAERVVAAQWHCVDERSARGLRACGGAILYNTKEKSSNPLAEKTYLCTYVVDPFRHASRPCYLSAKSA